MQIIVSITHSILIDVPEGTSIQDVRNEALDKINEDYEEAETYGDSPQTSVSALIQNAIADGQANNECVEISIREASAEG